MSSIVQQKDEQNNFTIDILSDKLSTVSLSNKINRGTGAGGANTNKNGLSYEKLTELDTEFEILSKNKFHNEIKFKIKSDRIFISSKQYKFFKYMDKYINKDIKKAHGCKKPDECYIDEEHKIIFIIEKKFQQVPGSVCEKVQTPHMKLWQYNRTFPDWYIVYIYCLSSWFQKNCIAELEYLNEMKYQYFIGSDKDYKNKIIKYILKKQDERIQQLEKKID